MSKYFKELIILTLPIVIGQLGIMLIGIGDVFIASKHAPLSLASIGIAVNFTNPIFLFGIGLMMGVSAFISIQIGKKKNSKNDLVTSLVFALLTSIFVMGVTYISTFAIDYIGLVKEMIPFIKSYINIVIFSFPFALIYQVLKEYLQAHEKVKFANSVAIISAVLNIPLNYCLVFGAFGMPALGFDGMAYASLLIRIFMAMIMLLSVYKLLPSSKLDKDILIKLLKFSLPIALMIFFEVLGFALFGVLAGKFGIVEAATNNLILNIASLTFMVPLSISSAVSVKVGNAYGNKSYINIRRFSFVALILSLSFMTMTALAYLLYPVAIMKTLSNDPRVILLGAKIFFIVAIFQIIDGIQVTLGGILRGVERTKESFLGIVIGFWIIGMPLGSYLGFYEKMKLEGLWIGLAIALTVVSFILSFITFKQFKIFNMSSEFENEL